jgi:hypothetical protein
LAPTANIIPYAARKRWYTDRPQLLLNRLPAGVMLISLEDQQVGLMNNQAAQPIQRMGVQ